MLPTPTTTHVPFTHVYEPAEDSYLLLDTLSSAPLQTLFRAHFPASSSSSSHPTSSPLHPHPHPLSSSSSSSSPSPPLLIVEIGTGSGVVLAFLVAHALHIFGREDVLALGVDVNAYACRATEETVRVACREVRERGSGGQSGGGSVGGGYLGNCVGDLTGALRGGEVDVLVFNPPYVPTEELPLFVAADGEEGEEGLGREELYERESRLLALSYAGGRDGMEVTERLLGEVPRVLSRRGMAFVLLCAQNRPEEVMERVRGWEGGGSWDAEVVGRSGKVAGWEKLVIVRIWRVGGGG